MYLELWYNELIESPRVAANYRGLRHRSKPMSTSNDTTETITIPLTQNIKAIIDDTDRDLCLWKWQSSHGYAAHAWRKNKVYGKDLMHRIILGRMLGRNLLPHEQVDHINGNRCDNRRSNLRLASYGENAKNAKRRNDNSTGLKGVSRDGNKYRARIQVNNKPKFLGNFETAEQAHEAYCNAAKELHGEFARFE
jgi:HNH endonuclease